jgi:hypothetical protein
MLYAYLIVVGLSLLLGAAVYSSTMRAGREGGPTAIGFEGPPGEGDVVRDPGPGYTYLRVATRGPSWGDRLQGFVGLIILLVVGTALLAFGIYQLGHLVNLTIERFLDG